MFGNLKQLFGAGTDATVAESERIAAEVDPSVAEAGQKQKEFLLANINDWLGSDKFKFMQEGQRYYESKNDILNRKRTVIGRNGEMVEAAYLANNRLPHAFMRKLTKQKIGYLLSKPFTVTSDDENFQEALGAYFTKDFYRLFKNGGQDAVVAGLGWLQIYYSEEGVLRFKRIPATEIIPFWEDIDHTILGSAIRVYDVEQYDGGTKKTIRKVQYFTHDCVFNYVMDDDGLVEDEMAPVEYNFSIQSDAVPATDGEHSCVSEYCMWDEIPLIPLKYNPEEDSLLKYIKELVDDYDRRTSDMSNVIQDEPDKVKVVKDYDGTDKGEFVFNLARYRTLFLRGTGSVETLDTSISTEAIEQHLTRLRAAIYEFKQDLMLKGEGDFTEAAIDVVFNTDITINETETISNIRNSVGIVSNKTLLDQHPYVTDTQEELKQLDQEAQEELDLQEESLRMMQSTQPQQTTPEPDQTTPPEGESQPTEQEV